MFAHARQSTRSVRTWRGIRAIHAMALAREVRRCSTPARRHTSALLRLRRWLLCNPGVMVLALAASEAVLIVCVFERLAP
jgi:hypothetical protein